MTTIHLTAPVRPWRLRAAVVASIAAGILIAVSAGSGSSSASDADDGVIGPGADGTFTARLVDLYAASASLELAEVELLTGEEARQAAVDAGELAAGEDLPNDVYLRDAETTTRRITVDPEATVAVIDCGLASACEPAPVPLADLLHGRANPYNGDLAVWAVTVEDGVLTSMAEVYLP